MEFFVMDDVVLGPLLTIKPLPNYTAENFRRRIVMEFEKSFASVAKETMLEGVPARSIHVPLRSASANINLTEIVRDVYDDAEITICLANDYVQILAPPGFDMEFIRRILCNDIYPKLSKWSKFNWRKNIV